MFRLVVKGDTASTNGELTVSKEGNVDWRKKFVWGCGLIWQPMQPNNLQYTVIINPGQDEFEWKYDNIAELDCTPFTAAATMNESHVIKVPLFKLSYLQTVINRYITQFCDNSPNRVDNIIHLHAWMYNLRLTFLCTLWLYKNIRWKTILSLTLSKQCTGISHVSIQI